MVVIDINEDPGGAYTDLGPSKVDFYFGTLVAPVSYYHVNTVNYLWPRVLY